MLRCLGLFAGFALGSMLGGPWTFIVPAIGFGLGLLGDIKLMQSSHGGHGGSGGSCCGSGHVHDETVMEEKDPVCGMGIDKETSYRMEFEGKTYNFCSQACMSKFQKEPLRYIKYG